MRAGTLAMILLASVAFGPAVVAQTETSPTYDGFQGAADNDGAVNPIWPPLVGLGFLALVVAGLVWRSRLASGRR